MRTRPIFFRTEDGSSPEDGSADAGESAADDADDQPTGNGTPGDGLARYEEYRGFIVDGQHIRTDPSKKDVFVFSQFDEGVGDAATLPVVIHEIDDTELDGFRRIAPNFTNSLSGGDIPGHFFGTLLNGQLQEQVAVTVFKDDFTDLSPGNTALGSTASQHDSSGQPQLGPPWTVGALGSTVYARRIRRSSPDNDSGTEPDDVDSPKTRQTIAHEIGHNLAIDHTEHPQLNGVPQCPPIATTVMVTNYFRPTEDANDCAWSNIPHVFEAGDLTQLRVR